MHHTHVTPINVLEPDIVYIS